MRKYYIFIGTLGIIVAALVIESFVLMGNPLAQKLQAQDETILNNFSSIKNSVESYYGKNRSLPPTLAALEYGLPKNIEKYEYKIMSPSSFNLCADFQTDTKSLKPTPMPRYYTSYNNELDTRHSKGHDCITYKISSYLITTPIPLKSPTPILTPLEAEQQILNASCSGQIVNKMCVLPGCMYTYPMNLYSQGGAVDSYGNSYTDYCANNKTSVMKYYCKPNNQINSYYNSTRMFNCANGCQDGKCIK